MSIDDRVYGDAYAQENDARLKLAAAGRTSTGYSVADIAQIVDICRSAGIRSFTYRDLQLVFDGNKLNGGGNVMRNPALRALLEGEPR